MRYEIQITVYVDAEDKDEAYDKVAPLNKLAMEIDCKNDIEVVIINSFIPYK